MPYISDDHTKLDEPDAYAKGFIMASESLAGRKYADPEAVEWVKNDRYNYEEGVRGFGIDNVRAYYLGARDACDCFLRISNGQPIVTFSESESGEG